jgi:hypothetical protein
MKKWNTLLIGWIFFSLFAGCATPRGADVPSHTLPQAKRDLIVLLPDPDGKVGTITVTTNGGSQVVDKPGYAIEIEDFNKTPIAPKPLNENEIKEVFGSALSAQPDPSNRFLLFILYFEHDTTKLTHGSKDLLSEVLRTIKNRKSNEVYVVGHTDLVGSNRVPFSFPIMASQDRWCPPKTMSLNPATGESKFLSDNGRQLVLERNAIFVCRKRKRGLWLSGRYFVLDPFGSTCRKKLLGLK